MPVFRLVAGMTRAQESDLTGMAHWGRLFGFIVVQVNRDGQAIRYFGRTRFAPFGDEGTMEDPTVYSTLRGANRRRAEMGEILNQGGLDRGIYGMSHEEGTRIAVAIWVHPESNFKPLEEYLGG